MIESGTAIFMTGGGSRSLASRDSSLVSAGGDHPPVWVDFVEKSGAGLSIVTDNLDRRSFSLSPPTSSLKYIRPQSRVFRSETLRQQGPSALPPSSGLISENAAIMSFGGTRPPDPAQKTHEVRPLWPKISDRHIEADEKDDQPESRPAKRPHS